MPYRRGRAGRAPRRRVARRAPVRRRRFFRRRRVFRPAGVRTQLSIPNVQRLRYVENFTINAVGGVLTFHNFRANGCHKPDVTGTGHQPMKWDQLNQFYNHYVVLGAKITVKCLGYIYPDLSLPSATGVLAVYLTDDTLGLPTDYRTMLEQGRGQYKLHNNAAGVTKVVNGYYSPRKFYNIRDIKDNFDRLGASVTTNPTEEAIFAVGYAEIGRDTQVAVRLMCVIDYMVAFSEPKDLAASS